MLALGLSILLPLGASAPVAVAPYRESPTLERLQRLEVRLGGSISSTAQGVVRNWLLPLPDRNPAILEMFRDRDRLPARDLLPWSGEFAGKYLTSGTEMLRLTGDPELKARLQRFVADLVALQDADGYLGPYAKAERLTGQTRTGTPQASATWDAWNHYHVLLGLLRWEAETGDSGALSAARRIGDLLCERFLAPGRPLATIGSPEMNLAPVHGLALLHRRTGDSRYRELAEKIVDEFSLPVAGDYLRGALAGEEFYQLPSNAPRWESLHTLLGVAELYWITGKPEYRRAFEHLYWSIAKTDRHNNGGFTSGERATGNPYDPGAIETCCTIAWTAMGVEMLRMTGDSRVADELELSTLNQIVGMHAPDGSWVTYNTPMEGVRIPSTEDISFQIRPGSEELNCCSVNGARGFGMIADWALMNSGSGLALNYYGPSTLQTDVRGVPVTVRQETDYPRGGRVTVRVEPERPTKFALKLRVPHWSRRTRMRVNGAEVATSAGSYAEVSRTWKKGDLITIAFDHRPRFWLGQRDLRGRSSVYAGPLLMALERPGTVPQYDRSWSISGPLHVTQRKDAAVEFRFTGDRVQWIGRRYDDAGQAVVRVDGREVGMVDQYGPGRDLPFVWEGSGFGSGEHTLQIVARGRKADASKGVWINVERLSPAAPMPRFSAAAFDRAKWRSDGTWEVLSAEGEPIRLREYGSAGRDRVPYTTWLPIRGVAPAAFTRENPSRTWRPQ